MKLLLDTHLLIWAATGSEQLSTKAYDLISDKQNALFFSVASLWEIAIKSGLGRSDFQIDPNMLRRGLIENGYEEVPITAPHTIAVQSLPARHKDPFDRMLIAVSAVEGFTLLTSDKNVAGYPGSIIPV